MHTETNLAGANTGIQTDTSRLEDSEEALLPHNLVLNCQLC